MRRVLLSVLGYKRFALALMASVAAQSMYIQPSKALWNGKPVSLEANKADKFAVLLSIKGRRSLDCSGVLIAPRAILTAGHCLYGASDVSVNVPGAGKTSVKAERWLVHPSWNAGLPVAGWDSRINASNSDKYIDLGVILLSEELKGVKPVRYARSMTSADGDFTSYGYARDGMLVPLNKIDTTSATALKRLSAQGPLKVFASGGSAWCQGDSGGAMTRKSADGETLVGVVGLGLGAINHDPSSALSAKWGNPMRVPKCGSYAYVIDVGLHSSWVSEAVHALSSDTALTASIEKNEKNKVSR